MPSFQLDKCWDHVQVFMHSESCVALPLAADIQVDAGLLIIGCDHADMSESVGYPSDTRCDWSVGPS